MAGWQVYKFPELGAGYNRLPEYKCHPAHAHLAQIVPCACSASTVTVASDKLTSQRFLMKRASLLLLISALAAPLTASAGEHFFVQLPVTVDPAAPMPEAVKTQCSVETSLGAFTLAEIGKRVDPAVQSVTTVDQAGNDKLVQVSILSVQASGGGAWSGPKSMTVRADLQQGGVKIGSSIFTRATSGGAFAGLTGTCTMLERVTTALGKDIAVWIARKPAALAGQPASKPAEPAIVPAATQ